MDELMKSGSGAEVPDVITRPASVDEIPALVEFVSTHTKEMRFDHARVREIGLAVEETLTNIISYACPDGKGEIRISCDVHDSGALLIIITDSGAPFNMLLAHTFPEIDSTAQQGKTPSTRLIKKAIKNIEYIRGTDRNTLIFTIAPETKDRQ